MGHPNYRNGFNVTCHEHVLDLPLSWHKPKMVFVNSMSDLFHRNVPISIIKRVFLTMNNARWHCFQVLTKRSDRMLKITDRLNLTSNIWLGVTVEEARFKPRIMHLLDSSSSVKFLSLEPLLGPMPDIPLKGIDWVIVGGESGPRARKMEKSWVSDVRDQCIDAGVPFFFKQWGGVSKKRAGRILDNKIWSQMPIIETNSAEQWH